MNRLLPRIEDLFPIVDETKTFSETPFNKEFDLLDFQSKLQIINDIVRQTMIFSNTPDPSNDVESLIGDSYTASIASIAYLKKLNIGKNHRSVFAWKKPYEPNYVSTTHVITLIDDDEGNTYQFDSTPIVGYKCGKVARIDDKFYEDYIIIDGELKEIFQLIRKKKFDLCNNNLTENEKAGCLYLLDYAKKFPILAGSISELCLLLSNTETNTYDRNKILLQNRINNGYDVLNKNDIIKMLQQIRIWFSELKELISKDTNYIRQIELTQLIMSILNAINPSQERILNLDNKEYKMSHLSPRFYLENGLNLVMIKPSSYILGFESMVRDTFLEGNYKAIGEYNLQSDCETDLGLKRMRLFHPHGYKYERAMTGPSSVFLIKRKADDICDIKRNLRRTLKNNVPKDEVIWFDNKPIVWDPIGLNFAHTSDDPSEACMDYACAYPEYQLMTRFMYPNPILTKEEKNERIRI